ncbi:MAG: germination protein YpeB [Christensenellaceae bacterium]|jgi:germination protein YpeB|nr:germination protein YpeB [Christensenellaceae bacterium]
MQENEVYEDGAQPEQDFGHADKTPRQGGGKRHGMGWYVLPAVLALALAGVVWWGTQQRAEAMDYKSTAESMYRRAYGELSDNLYEMESGLGKLQAANSSAQQILLLDDLWRLSGSATSCMAQLPLSHVDTKQINQFVVRLGDYAHSLTKKAIRGTALTEEDANTIAALRNACAKLAIEIGQRYTSGNIPLLLEQDGYYASAQAADAAADDAAQQGEGQDAGSKDNEGIEEFPTLIYDGPFAESAEKQEAKGLTGGNVTKEQAQKTAEGIAGQALTYNGLVESAIRAHDFSGNDERGNWVEAEITEQGGALLWYMRSASGNKDGRPDDSEAARYRDAALKKLSEMGYEGMQSTYAQYYGGKALINCAATQADAILYSDLIKVWVDRETLEVIGIDARNYLFSHVERALPALSLPIEEAEAKVSKNLEIVNRALALIPLSPQSEQLCYEFKCTLGEDSYIIYINVETGDEEQIFKIIDSENGTLVI